MVGGLRIQKLLITGLPEFAEDDRVSKLGGIVSATRVSMTSSFLMAPSVPDKVFYSCHWIEIVFVDKNGDMAARPRLSSEDRLLLFPLCPSQPLSSGFGEVCLSLSTISAR